MAERKSMGLYGIDAEDDEVKLKTFITSIYQLA